MKHSTFVLIFILSSFISFSSKAEKKEWTPSDTLLIKQISDLKISPNGDKILISILEPIIPDNDPKKIKALLKKYILENKTGMLNPLDKNHHVLSFDWSYDGKWIFYTTGSVDTGTIWAILSKGGKPKKIFEAPYAGANFSPSPDGKKIAISVAIPQNNQFNPKLPEVYGQIYVVYFDGKNFENPRAEALTPSIMNVSLTVNPIFTWSPDSQYLTFSIDKIDWRGSVSSTLAIVDVETKKVRDLVSGNNSLATPFFSPNQQYIAFIKSSLRSYTKKDRKGFDYKKNICLYTFKSKKSFCLPGDLSGLNYIIGWIADSKNILYSRWDKTKANIHQINLEGKDRIVNDGLKGVISEVNLSPNNKYLGFLYSNLETPKEVYFSSLPSFKPRQITHIQRVSFLRGLKSEVIEWKSFDGRKIEGILTYPEGYKEGTKVPLVLWIHGGPHGLSKEDFQGEITEGPFSPAVFAGAGYAVLQPNYRGSMGYGDKFTSLSYKDFGDGEFKDILSGIDFLVDKGLVDSKRITIGGWSYGGFLSVWAVTHDQRFKAAIVGAAPIDWYADNAIIDNATNAIKHMGKNIKDWFKMSPLMTIRNAKTPVLIQHGSNDERVSLFNSIEFSYALKRLKVPYRFIVYKGQGHNLYYSSYTMYQGMMDQLEWIKSHISPYKP